MSGKFFLYVAVTFLVIWAMDSVNINKIFKKDKILQARIFYFFLGISMIYLVTNFIFDIFSFFIYVDILDLVRIIISTLVVFLFLLLRDGIGDDAIFGTATRIYYRDILAYDFKRSDKSFNVYFLYNDQKDASKGKGPYNLCIEFDLSKEKDVICTLQNKLPKKYKRLKKDNI